MTKTISLKAYVFAVALQMATPLHAGFSTLLSGANSRQQCAEFIDNIIYRQVASADFLRLADELAQGAADDDQLYAVLLARINQIKPRFFFAHQLRALSRQKKILALQARKLLGNRTSLDGCLEIGTPGTYLHAMSSFFALNGTMYVLNEKESWSDYLQGASGSPSKRFLMYDTRIPLNDYAPIGAETLPDESLDLITCFIGLHHVPPVKLDEFVASLCKKLRPGGVMLLRDHDCDSREQFNIASAAHTIFNLIVDGVSLRDEKAEVRNFQPLAYWIELLEHHGLKAGSDMLVQRGDPTLNVMMAFTKPLMTEQDVVRDLKKESAYERPLEQGILTSPEWVNVDIAREYSDFIEHTPFYEFPYMKSLASYWQVFGRSFAMAREKAGFWKAATSPYMLMNAFVGVTMTAEHCAKALISLPVRLMYSGSEDSVIKVVVRDPQGALAQLPTSSEVKVLERYQCTSMALLSVPRYMKFMGALRSLATTPGLVIVEVAGQKQLMFKVRTKDVAHLQGDTYALGYTWTLPTKPDYTYAVISVNVAALAQAFAELEQKKIELIYIHDF